VRVQFRTHAGGIEECLQVPVIMNVTIAAARILATTTAKSLATAESHRARVQNVSMNATTIAARMNVTSTAKMTRV